MAEEDQESEVEEVEESGGSKLVLILTGINLLVTLGVAGLVWFSFQAEDKNPNVDDISLEDESAHAEGGEKGDGKGGGHGGDGQAGAEGAGGHGGTDIYGKMVTLDQFTINLSTDGAVSPKYARVNISVEVGNEDTEVEITSKMPQVRNTIIDLFNSKRPDDLGTPEGRNFLKEEIKNALNGFLSSGKVQGIFFTNFALSG